MSILPFHSQESSSSSSPASLSLNSNSNHDYLVSSSSPLSNQIPGPLASTAQDSSGSPKEVIESRASDPKRSYSHQKRESQFRNKSGGRELESSHSKGQMSAVSPSSQQISGSSNSPGAVMHSGGRRGQMINGNHLLNFHYDPVSRPQYRSAPPPPRRQRKMKPYNKDLFLQANYKFVVLDTGNYSADVMDPDKMLQWEDIICVRYSTPTPVQCPICLDNPLCPQITSCGHIFCLPCILQYLLMGEENHKRCPLCFVMISPKDLYTIYIENVKQYSIGDTIDFMLLTREKDSFVLSQKNKQNARDLLGSSDGTYDPFAKFTFTSDVELSVRQAISDLDGWLVRADSGLVDDLGMLPYVCAALEQLEQRKKDWNEHRARECTKSSTECQTVNHGSHSAKTASSASSDKLSSGKKTVYTDPDPQTILFGKLTLDQLSGGSSGEDTTLSSCDEKPLPASSEDKEKDSYNFYQAVDGQHFILHPLNMKCLLHHYGSYDALPHRISGRILQLETVTQSEAMRKRYRFLSHFSLTTTFELCEIDLSDILPADALAPFMDEIKKRERQRKQLAKKERKEKMKADAALVHSMPEMCNFRNWSPDDSPAFSMDDFEALGNSPVVSSSPPTVGGRGLFSNVTRLGFAAAHDSPALKPEETNSSNTNTDGSSSLPGPRNPGTSFANVISKAKSAANAEATPKMNEMGKKGKKPSRVLLSTSGGRRY